MSAMPKAHEVYRHFKGNTYEIVTVAEHTESGEELVIYKAMYGDGKVYARPLTMFLSPVDKEKYPEVMQEMRFELVKADTGKEIDSIDPDLLEFLDAGSYEEKLSILTRLHMKLTDEMLNTMAVSCDVEISDKGDIEDRYIELKNCLLLMEKYECSRLRSV